MRYNIINSDTFEQLGEVVANDIATATKGAIAMHGNTVMLQEIHDAPVVATPKSEGTTKPNKETKMKSDKTNVCWCGCGGATKSKFVPGHDARFHGEAKRYARAIAAGELPETPDFVHAEAEADFMKWADRELPLAEAKEAAKKAKTTEAKVETETEAKTETETEETPTVEA